MVFAYKADEANGLGTYVCRYCDESYSADDYRAGTAVYMSSPPTVDLSNYLSEVGGHEDHDCGYYYYDTEDVVRIPIRDVGVEEDVWWCGSGCLHHDDGTGPVVKEAETWVCDECEEEYDSDEYENPKQVAMECCT